MAQFFPFRPIVVVAATVLLLGSGAASVASAPTTCARDKAKTIRVEADRFAAHGNDAVAATSYLAASRQTQSCPDGASALLSARSIAQAAVAFAQTGDYGKALTLLGTAQTRLTALEARDPKIAPAARAFRDVVESVIGTVDLVAQSSM